MPSFFMGARLRRHAVRGKTGVSRRVQILPKLARGEIIRLPGEGLPKARGGRGELQVRIRYPPNV
jgi:DnaJ-class molecular chaperone